MFSGVVISRNLVLTCSDSFVVGSDSWVWFGLARKGGRVLQGADGT